MTIEKPLPGKSYIFHLFVGVMAVFLLLAPETRAAEQIELEMPIQCMLGEDCWLVNYVDTDPSEGAADYACGKATYDGHKGVDIAIADARRMRDGVAVYASAAGRVMGTRNDMTDIDFTQNGGRQSVAKKECGNGVVIDHGKGWTTQYCHMMKGSVIVAKGDTLASGEQIGLVGLSGLTQFPHIHIQVKYKGVIVDPFTGIDPGNDCAVGRNPLWNKAALKALRYQPTAIFNAGFTASAPNARHARDGRYAEERLLDTSPVMALWADIYWLKPGDKVTFLITGPKGEALVAHTSVLKKAQARRFLFAGKQRKKKAWVKGMYTGEVRLIRPATGEEFAITRKITVD